MSARFKVGDKVRLTTDPDYTDEELQAELKAAGSNGVGTVLEVKEEFAYSPSPTGGLMEVSTGFGYVVRFPELEEDYGRVWLIEQEVIEVTAVDRLGELADHEAV